MKKVFISIGEVLRKESQAAECLPYTEVVLDTAVSIQMHQIVYCFDLQKYTESTTSNMPVCQVNTSRGEVLLQL